MKKIMSISFNWHFSPADNATYLEWREVGVDGVVTIEHCCDFGCPAFFKVIYGNGTETWIYNPNRVEVVSMPASENPPSSDHFDLPF